MRIFFLPCQCPLGNWKLKSIKVERRASLSNKTLNNLFNTDPVPFEDFNLDPALQMWWDDKVRQTNQKHRSSSTGVEVILVKVSIKISFWMTGMSGSFRHKTLTLNCQSFNFHFSVFIVTVVFNIELKPSMHVIIHTYTYLHMR